MEIGNNVGTTITLTPDNIEKFVFDINIKIPFRGSTFTLIGLNLELSL